MPIRRLHSGNYECPECEELYLVTDMTEEELLCPDCGVNLDEVASESEDEGEVEEEQEDA